MAPVSASPCFVDEEDGQRDNDEKEEEEEEEKEEEEEDIGGYIFNSLRCLSCSRRISANDFSTKELYAKTFSTAA